MRQTVWTGREPGMKPAITLDLVMNRQAINDTRVLSFATASRVAFLCECDGDGCLGSVLMSPPAFIARRESGEAIICAGHVATADAPMRAERAFVTEAETAPDMAAGGAPLPQSTAPR